jgi:hypothetical protein
VKILIRTIIGLFTGLLGGAIFGAVIVVAFFLPAYFAGNAFIDKLGPLVLIGGFIGGQAGLIAGGIIGFIVGVFGLRKLYAAITGIVVMLIEVNYLLGPPTAFRKPEVLLTILAAVAAAALGALVSAIITRFQSRRTLSDDSVRC